MRRKFRVVVNGKEYVVEVEEIGGEIRGSNVEVAQTTQKKVAPVKTTREREVKKSVNGAVEAPMPGKILSIRVSAGEKVSRGQVLMILEAMKMENEITAPKDGVVKEVLVKEGDSVGRGDPLVLIE